MYRYLNVAGDPALVDTDQYKLKNTKAGDTDLIFDHKNLQSIRKDWINDRYRDGKYTTQLSSLAKDIQTWEILQNRLRDW